MLEISRVHNVQHVCLQVVRYLRSIGCIIFAKLGVLFLNGLFQCPVSLNVGVLHLFCGNLGNMVIVLVLFCVLLFPF